MVPARQGGGFGLQQGRGEGSTACRRVALQSSDVVRASLQPMPTPSQCCCVLDELALQVVQHADVGTHKRALELAHVAPAVEQPAGLGPV